MSSPYVSEVQVGQVYRMDQHGEQLALVVSTADSRWCVVDIYKRKLRGIPADGSTFRSLQAPSVEQGPLFQGGV